MIKQGSFIAATTALLIFAAGCQKKSGKDEGEADAGVQVTLKQEDLALLADQNPTEVRIRVFKVENDVTGDQEGGDNVFQLAQDSATYSVSKVKLGYKQFDVSILNSASESLGDGTARYLVKPGLQQMEPIAITIRDPAVRRRDVEMNLWVQVTPTGETPKTTYLDVKQTIAQCAGCHTDVAGDGSQMEPKGGLNLKQFPFVSLLHPDWTQDDIVADMVYWMKDPTDPMPPAPRSRIPDADIDLVEKWRTDGLLMYPANDQTADLAVKIKAKWTNKATGEWFAYEVPRGPDPAKPFVLTLKDLVIKGSYDVAFQVIGIDGSVTYETTMASYILAESGSFDHILQIPYSEPKVDIPVVVTRK